MAIELVVGIAVVSLLLGLGIGYFLPPGNAEKARVAELEAALDTSQQELSDYKSEVFGQFSDTAQKFRALDKSYNDLHRQLAQSSVALCGDAATPLLASEVSEVHESDNPSVTTPDSVLDSSSDDDTQLADVDLPDATLDTDEAGTLGDDILVTESSLNDEVIDPSLDADSHAAVAEEVPTLTEVDGDVPGEKVAGEKDFNEQDDADERLQKSV